MSTVEIYERLDDNGYVSKWCFVYPEFVSREGRQLVFPVGDLIMRLLNSSGIPLEEFPRNISDAFSLLVDKFDFRLKLPTESRITALGRVYIIPFTDDFSVPNSFLLVDLYELLRHSDIRIEKCVYCGNLYVHRKKGQKYCPKCVQEKVSERLKRENRSEQCKLRQKIYGRLYVRDGANNNRDYGYGIYDSESFTKVAKAYRQEHTSEEYLSWLHTINDVTRQKSGSE